MVQLPITLERRQRPDEDLEVITEIEIDAAAKGGKIGNKEKTLTELFYGSSPDEMLSLNQFLENE